MSYKKWTVNRRPDVPEKLVSLSADILKQTELRRALREPVGDAHAVRRLVVWRMFREDAGSAYAFFLNSRRRCIRTERLCENGIRMTDSYTDCIKQAALRDGAAYFIVAHNHVGEPLVPSPDDLQLTMLLDDLAEGELKGKCIFLGHYITSEFDVIKIEEQR